MRKSSADPQSSDDEVAVQQGIGEGDVAVLKLHQQPVLGKSHYDPNR